MQFRKELREWVMSVEITTSVRIWKSQRVKAGNAYRMSQGHIVADSIYKINFEDITLSLARETGFRGVASLVKSAKHGHGENVYLVALHHIHS